MSPREVIARALYARYNPKGDWDWLPGSIQKSYLADADAAIDALDAMGVTAAMDLAAHKVSREHELDLSYDDTLALWLAMVGAMRDE